jgi:hypothetical protein
MIGAVRHARSDALDRLEPLLVRLRQVEALRERSRGVFYRGSKAFLHFHEDGDALFADVRFGPDFERKDVTTAKAQDQLLRQIRSAL